MRQLRNDPQTAESLVSNENHPPVQLTQMKRILATLTARGFVGNKRGLGYYITKPGCAFLT